MSLSVASQVDRPLSLLCIDDEPLGLKIRTMVLEQAGYRVLTALDGAAGLEIFRRESVDAVVLDYFMPGMNGGEVAAEMRRCRPQVPILLLTAYINLSQELIDMTKFTLLKGEGPVKLLDIVQRMVHRGEAH